MPKKIIFIILGIFVILGLVICGYYFSLNRTVGTVLPISNTADIVLPIDNNKTEKPEIKTEAIIISVGDIFLHDTNFNSVFNASTKSYNFDSVFLPVADYFNNADLSTAWLGGVMDAKGPYAGYPLFKSPVALIDTLQNIGLDVVFRTNHTMDYGIKGLKSTTEILDTHNISQVAAYATEENSKKIFIFQKDDLKIAYLGYIYGMNGLPIPEPWMINLIDLNKIQSDISEAKKQSDFVIVALHFGNEYQRYPSAWQKDTAQKIADYGADMIIGSHPHVIQPVEMVNSSDGRKVYVAYSLGNFYCGQREHYTDAGMILKYTIEKIQGETRLKEIRYIPTWVAQYKENGKNQYKILPSKKYIDLYQQGQANFLSLANYNRLKQTYQETVQHLNNPDIGFIEEE